MSKRAAVRVDHLSDMPLDLPGVFLRFERRFWADGTSCLHIAKWGTRDGKVSPWWPLQYVQVPWELHRSLLVYFADATLVGGAGIGIQTPEDAS